MPEDNLSKAELALIDRIITTAGLAKFRNTLWQKVQQAFGFSFHGTNIEYGFARATPDERSLAYLEDRIFILSDKTQAKLVGDLRWELLEGMKNAESVDEIKRRLDGIFKGNTVNTERIARTETLNAMNAGRQNAYEVSEVVHYKMWRAAMNNARIAADSKRVNGQLQEVGNPFIDPKTGDSFMHPPNRPNCRCTTIPMCKLPENIVHKSGQMYAADEMVGKIEIDVGSLNKSEKRIWVKATSKRKGHYRKVKGAKKVESEKLEVKKAPSLKDKGVKITENLSNKTFYHLTDAIDFKPSAEFEQGVQEFGRGLYITEKSNIGFWEHQMQGREYAVPIDISKLKIVKEGNLPTMSEMSKDLKELGYTGKDIAKLEPKAGTINRKPFEIAVKRTWVKEAGFQGIIPKTIGEYSTEQLVIFDMKGVDVGKPESTYELRLREKMYTFERKE